MAVDLYLIMIKYPVKVFKHNHNNHFWLNRCLRIQYIIVKNIKILSF